MEKNIKESLFALVRLGIGKDGTISSDIDWQSMISLANQQGISAIVVDGIDRLPCELRPPKPMMLQLIGVVLHNYESRFNKYLKTIAELSHFYNSHGLKMMVLKGYACSLNWPKPEHRHLGDIDIWQFGEYKKADALLASEKGINVDNSHHHHTVFYWHDFMVENHYDFINVHHHKSNVELERVFKKLAEDDSYFVDVDGERIYLPSPNLHALFLLKHSMSDFTSCSVSIRQILDWAFHVQKYGNEIDWKWLFDVLEKFHMKDFFNIINAVCVENLGFDFSCLKKYGLQMASVDQNLKECVLDDTLYPKFSLEEPSRLFSRLVYKYRRWKSNGWKHRLCYNESMWSAFRSGVWNHLLKPSSI